MDVEETNNFMHVIMILKSVQGELIMLPDLTGCHWRHVRCYWDYLPKLHEPNWVIEKNWQKLFPKQS